MAPELVQPQLPHNMTQKIQRPFQDPHDLCCAMSQSMAADLAQSELAHVKYLQAKLGGLNSSALAPMPVVRAIGGTIWLPNSKSARVSCATANLP